MHRSARSCHQALVLVLLFAVMQPAGLAFAQDIQGIENCMAEKQIERRTSCLQSNVNFLKSTIATEIGKARAEAQAKLDEAAKQITALQLVVTGLQAEVKRLRSDADAAKANAAKPASK